MNCPRIDRIHVNLEQVLQTSYKPATNNVVRDMGEIGDSQPGIAQGGDAGPRRFSRAGLAMSQWIGP
jgi:hypothetical protein